MSNTHVNAYVEDVKTALKATHKGLTDTEAALEKLVTKVEADRVAAAPRAPALPVAPVVTPVVTPVVKPAPVVTPAVVTIPAKKA